MYEGLIMSNWSEYFYKGFLSQKLYKPNIHCCSLNIKIKILWNFELYVNDHIDHIKLLYLPFVRQIFCVLYFKAAVEIDEITKTKSFSLAITSMVGNLLLGMYFSV